ncbi:hypothetical protein BD289DRAFT_449575 [Coniella lustricola]|uniref:Uncharacterized protein n=1 Tax=Coniella lustricola TaxID=2025994 RepID=A0A2T3AM71_9PEZI|nr:hypothetical protein BD289DRAFT_449575 [Coniella lustricola]
MARDRERGDTSISPSTGQSKRSSTSRDLDPLASDQAQRPHAQQQHQQHQQHRKHPQQKHHVGGGGRLHARVPSSKGLGLIKQTASSTKLTRRITSPSPERHTIAPATLTSSSNLTLNHHRKQSSDSKLARDSSTNLKKNASQTSLKRNRSHVDVTKRNKSSGQLKRSASEKTVTTKLRPSKSAVHFDLGNDGQLDQDEEDNEWVDASSSASPYLSRRGSVIASGSSSAQAQGSPAHGVGGSSGTAVGDNDDDDNGDEEPTPLAEPHKALFSDPLEHSRNLTSRLLQRTPSHSATTSMSNMTAMAKAASPDSKHSASTLSVTSALSQPQGIAGSNGNDEVTSRFISSQEGGGSFYTTSGNSISGKRQSMGRLHGPTDTGLSTATTQMHDDDDDDDDDDDEELIVKENTGITSAIATTARSRKEGRVAAPSEKSRTQQKINLQRASSSMEPVRHRHSGIGGFAAEVAEVAGPLIGGAGYESQDPRVYKLLERTGVEYNIVRRYQNPVARSLARLTLLPGNDKARRIPRGTPSSRHSVPNFGLSQSFHETASSKRPETPKRACSTVRHGALGSSLDTDDGGAAAARMHEGAGSRLSGASLVNGEEDEGIQAILRSMWDKNLTELAASAE